jgi:putative intracellular protease/amidase
VAPVDPLSVEYSTDDVSQEFLSQHRHLFEQTEALEKFLGKAAEFDAIFYPGGHGPMFDIAANPVSIELIKEFASHDKTLAAVCHGPAAFVNVVLPDGRHLLEGKTVTGLSNAEEESFQMTAYMPFPLETKLNQVTGGLFTAKDGDKDVATVIVESEGKLITGQNPKSGKSVGEAILRAIGITS